MIHKEELRAEIQRILKEKLTFAQLNFSEAQESVGSETKSSAGDKHETSRAMAQIELENAGKILKEAEKNLELFKNLNFTNTSKVAVGSLIHTNFELFFVGIGLGKINFKNKTIFCLNLNSPIGQLIQGKIKGESFTFNEKKYTILELN
jgi:hypothetical protein